MIVDGVELLRMVRDGELEDQSSITMIYNDGSKEEIEIDVGYIWVQGDYISCFELLGYKFEILSEDEEIDIDSMEELLKIEAYEVDKTDTAINRDAINELIRAVKKIYSEVNQLKGCKNKLNWEKAEESANKLKEKYNNL